MSILASRFLMNLRHAANAATFTVDTQSPSYVRDNLWSFTSMSSVEFTPRSVDSGAKSMVSGLPDINEEVEFLHVDGAEREEEIQSIMR